MTREKAEKYQIICAELKRLNSIAIDVVTGSSDEFPYTIHPFTIKGAPSSPSIDHRRRQLEKAKADIEAFGRMLPERQRKVFGLRVIEGLSWKDVAQKLGSEISSDGAKMLYHRIFRKKIDK